MNHGAVYTYKIAWAGFLMNVVSSFALAHGEDSSAVKTLINPQNAPAATQTVKASITVYDSIAGPLPDSVKAHGRPYLVVGDIEVPVNKSVTIEAGTVFLFKNFTGIHVQGKLIAKGTKERPIVFTSENDRSVNPATSLYPNPYDWNGVYIHSSGLGATLSFCNVFYSVYGIISETKFIRLDPVSLRFNGKSNLMIEGKLRKVNDQAYYYVLSTKDAFADGVPAALFKDPNALKRGICRYACYTLMVTSVILCIESGVGYLNAKNKLASKNDDSDRAALRDERDRYSKFTAVCGAAFIAGSIGFYWTFTF